MCEEWVYQAVIKYYFYICKKVKDFTSYSFDNSFHIWTDELSFLKYIKKK